MSINSYPVSLRMKVIDRGYAGTCPNTFKEKRHYAIQDEAGILKEEITLICTRDDLSKRLMQIRVSYGTKGYVTDPSVPVWQRQYIQQQYRDPLRGAKPIGPGWSFNHITQHTLQRAHVPASIARVAGVAVDMLMTKKMHQDFLTSGSEMKEAFHKVFKW